MTKCRHILYACIAGLGCNFVCQSAFGYTLDWTANSLNQYTEFTHDADGNMAQCGDWTYTYDAANRLKTVSSNGVLIVTNFYDAKSRRVKKVTKEATMTFFYDGWNLVEERIAYINGTTTTIHYYWGKDLSGTLQGAGGVGGLLYLTVDGVPYIPNYDNIGNIMCYLDANGNSVAQYTYDAFGNTLSQSGTMCGMFRHRFSTKYFDVETGLYYYLMRFYHPPNHRWLNRDPIEEEGGVNLYAFCGNNSNSHIDLYGCSLFDYLPFLSTILAAIEKNLGHVPGSAVTDYSFVSPGDCKCNIEGAEANCRAKVAKEAIDYGASFAASVAIARGVDFGVGILALRANPYVGAALFVDGGIGLYINLKAAGKIMNGANNAQAKNCSCAQYRIRKEY